MNVIFNTELRFSDLTRDIGRYGVGSLHHQDAARLLVKVIEEFITAGRQRPDINDAFTAGRDDLFHAQRNALEFHWCRVEIFHSDADGAIGERAYLARLEAMILDTEIATLALCCALVCSLVKRRAVASSVIAKRALSGRTALRGKRLTFTKSS